MSKSLGNFFTIADVRGRYTPQSLRLFVLSTHYRNPINFSDAALDECAARVAYFYETLRKLEVFLDQRTDPVVGPLPGEAFLREAEAQFVEAMDDDFNTVRVLGVLAEAYKLLNEYLNTRKAKALPAAVVAARTLRDSVMRMDTVLQLFTEDPGDYLEAHRHLAASRRGLDLDWVSKSISDRLVARGDKDWAEADRLRDVLLAAGVVLMDGPHGTEWSVQDTREPPATLS
jgi:cysteinyl-tRNA synthetase